jgi:quercetin dioxygenase-like cupin family protein
MELERLGALGAALEPFRLWSGVWLVIRCIRIWTADAGASCFEEGTLALSGGKAGDAIGKAFNANSISFRETQPQDALAWHDAPTHQLVLTLGGTLEFETRDGQTFIIRPGDVLLAEDTTGSGHRWRLIGEEPWRRAYVILPEGLEAGFTRND